MPSSQLNDQLAHINEKRTLEIVRRMLGRLTSNQESMQALLDSLVSPTSERGSDSTLTATTVGMDYTSATPVATVYSDIGERIDNLDSNIAIPFTSHNHDGITTPAIPAKNVSVSASISGNQNIATLEDWIAMFGGKGGNMFVGTVVRSIPIISMAMQAYGSAVPETSSYQGTVQFNNEWSQIIGVVGSLNGIRNIDGSAFDMNAYRWCDRSMTPVFSVDEQSKLISFTLSLKFGHVIDPNIQYTKGNLRLLADLSIIAFGL